MMSMTSCEIASSQRSASGGDFQCTADELYDRFMQIVANEEQQQSALGAADVCGDVDQNLSGNNSNVPAAKVSVSSEHEGDSADTNKTFGELPSEVMDPGSSQDKKLSSVGHRNTPLKSSVLLGIRKAKPGCPEQCEAETNILLGENLTKNVCVVEQSSSNGNITFSKQIDAENTLRNLPSNNSGQSCDETGTVQDEELGLAANEPNANESQLQNQQEVVALEVISNVTGTQAEQDTKEAADTEGAGLPEAEPDTKEVADTEGVGLPEAEPESTPVIEEQETETTDASDAQVKIEQDNVRKHSVHDDIEEGIRKASQVCDEINEFIHSNRMSSSSDIILSSSEGAMVEPIEGNKNQVFVDNTAVVEHSVVNQEDRASSKTVGDNGEIQETAKDIPSIAKVCANDDSSSTCSSLQDGPQKSNECDKLKSDEHDKQEKTESLSSSSEGSMSPSSNTSSINWEILNTALGNGDTDDEGEIYEASRQSYGGFGLMLDDDTHSQGLSSVADMRLRSVSQSSTASEFQFQKEYQAQHSTQSLDRKQENILCSGYLLKLGGTGITPKNWRKRWCVLRHDYCLYYYKTNKDKVPSGIVVLTNYVVSRGTEFHKKNCLKLSKGGGRTYYFCCDNSSDMIRWMDALRKAANVVDQGTNFEIREEIIHNVAIPALSIKKPDCHGYLTKQGGKNRNSWKRRYCVLKNGCLYYYREMSDTTALGVAKLHGYTLEEAVLSGKRKGFRALPPTTGMRTFSFFADNEYDQKRWIPCLEQSIRGTNNNS